MVPPVRRLPVVRLIGLWTEPADIDAFEHDYLGSHFPRLRGLVGSHAAMTSRCIEGQYFRLTEVSFSSTDDMNTALETDLGKEIMAGARSVAEKYGVQLEVLVVADAT
jgi:hypothetical protein